MRQRVKGCSADIITLLLSRTVIIAVTCIDVRPTQLSETGLRPEYQASECPSTLSAMTHTNHSNNDSPACLGDRNPSRHASYLGKRTKRRHTQMSNVRGRLINRRATRILLRPKWESIQRREGSSSATSRVRSVHS